MGFKMQIYVTEIFLIIAKFSKCTNLTSEVANDDVR